NLANNIQSFPLGIFGVSFAMAAFPALASMATKKDKDGLIEVFSDTLRQIMFFVIPATVLLIVLRAQLVRTILGSGLFNWEDTIMTADALALFSLSLFAQAALPLLIRVFFAQQDSKTPFIIGLISAGINIILSWSLSSHWGVAGLALAFSISSFINLVLLWVVLRLQLGSLGEARIFLSVGKILAAALMMGASAQAVKYIVEPYVNMDTFLGILTQGLLAGLAGLVAYGLVGLLLRSQEMLVFKQVWQRRLLKITKATGIDESAGR
ncbi:MAG: oligosaccharide flippase family protein, partial [bacterium]